MITVYTNLYIKEWKIKKKTHEKTNKKITTTSHILNGMLCRSEKVLR